MCLLDKTEICFSVRIHIIIILFHRSTGYSEGYFEKKTSYAYTNENVQPTFEC